MQDLILSINILYKNMVNETLILNKIIENSKFDYFRQYTYSQKLPKIQQMKIYRFLSNNLVKIHSDSLSHIHYLQNNQNNREKVMLLLGNCVYCGKNRYSDIEWNMAYVPPNYNHNRKLCTDCVYDKSIPNEEYATEVELLHKIGLYI